MSDARISEIERRLESAALDIRGLAGGAAFGWQSLREMATEAVFRHQGRTFTVLGCDRVAVAGCVITQADATTSATLDVEPTDGNGEATFGEPDGAGNYKYTFTKNGYTPLTIHPISDGDLVETIGPGNPYTGSTAGIFVDGALGGAGARGSTTCQGGSILAITLQAGGSGYPPSSSVPALIPSVLNPNGAAPDGVATAHAVTNASGVVTGFVVDDPGRGFLCWWGCGPVPYDFLLTDSNQGQVWLPPVALGSSPPPITYAFTSPVSYTYTLTRGGLAAAHATFDGAGHLAAIVLDAAGYDFLEAPIVTIGPPPGQVQAEAGAFVSGGRVTGFILSVPGQQYRTAPTVTIDPPGGGGTTATAHATVADGKVASLVLDTPGSGYTAAPIVTIGPPDVVPTPATAHATLTTGGDTVAAIALDAAGDGYWSWSPPAVLITLPDQTEYELKLSCGGASAQVRSTYSRADPTTGLFRATFDFTGTSAAAAAFGGGSAIVTLDQNG